MNEGFFVLSRFESITEGKECKGEAKKLRSVYPMYVGGDSYGAREDWAEPCSVIVPEPSSGYMSEGFVWGLSERYTGR